jgi:molybdenum cofactor biosynthesis enzyme MoaA/nicotinamide mononucleotide adenylyltransferase
MKSAINFHLIDNCNSYCKHCFINKENHQLNIEKLKRIVDMLCYHNVVSKFKIDKINLAGGEPMLYENILELIDYIHLKNVQCSIITNGTLLTKNFIDNVADKLYMIGISIDGIKDETNKKLGRTIIKNIDEICGYIKEKGIKLKINVCVSRQNINENFYDFFSKINPDRIKLLQMIPYKNESKKDSITVDEFNTFCSKLSDFNPVCETNEFISSEYIIIDSKGVMSLNNYHNSKNDVLSISSDVFSKMINFYYNLSYSDIAELEQTRLDEKYHFSLIKEKTEPIYPLGVVHGRFQCLHYGHIEYILSALSRCKHLLIGITNFYPLINEIDSADENRFKPESNPFSFYERMIMIKNSLLNEGIELSRFDIIPFPIEKEENISYFAPQDAIYFITIYDEWGKRKKEKLNKLGLSIEVMWEKNISQKPTSATLIRKMIADDEKNWVKMVPNAVSEYILENPLSQKIKGGLHE